MDQYMAAVIIAIVTGIFSMLTIIVQRSQDKVVNKIDEQSVFMAREKDIKNRISQAERKRERTIHEITILLLNSIILIFENLDSMSRYQITTRERAEELISRFHSISSEIQSLYKEYDTVTEMLSEFKQELNKNNNIKK